MWIADSLIVAAPFHPQLLLAERYAVVESAGEGGMGTVYRGHDRKLDRPVAIKVMRPEWMGDEHVTGRFAHEKRVLARLDHGHVSRLLDAGETPAGLPYMVIEWIDGRELGQVHDAEGPLTLARIARLTGQLLRALGATHAAGVVHGDLKPENILIVGSGATETIKLIDFGLAHLDGVGPALAAPREGEARELCGTPEYMAPETISGAELTPAADLYGVGVLLYELLTGDTPFGGGHPAQILARHLADVPVRPSLRCPERVLPAAVDDVLLRALAKQPSMRPHSALAMAGALANAFASAGVTPEWRCPTCDAPAASPVKVCAVCGSDEGAATSRVSAARREAPTRPHAGLTPAAGMPKVPRESPHLLQLRRSIGAAIARGDLDEVVLAYHSLAGALVQAHQDEAALRELEEGIDVVTAGSSPEASRLAGLWRLLLAQAHLLFQLHLPAKARARASQAAVQAGRVGSMRGRTAAQQLLLDLDHGHHRPAQVVG
ncbi:MAG: serine/threonine protein kinase [Deltaproteobacteria bacterium]|nr:serine/threonine protein kinase [Deltaproteobacteria bacterium]